MRMRRSLGFALALLAGPVGAEPAGCDALLAAVEGAVGLPLSGPPAAMADGWCVLDGARSPGDGDLRVSVERLRVRGEADGAALRALEVDGEGVRVAPALSNRDMAGWLRDLMRLQSASLHLALRRDEAGDRLVLEGGRLGLSGGGELVLSAEVAGANLSAASLLAGRVTVLHLEWKNDGHTLRPVLEALGAGLEPGASGTKAVLAARAALTGVIEAMPGDSLPEDAGKALQAFVAALPQGRGRLVLDFVSEDGIGAAQVALLALAEQPTAPKALARLFAGSGIGASWTAGMAP
jgi:hypothetical protein